MNNTEYAQLVIEITSATLGYNDIKTTNLDAQAVSIIHKGPMRNYFTSCG